MNDKKTVTRPPYCALTLALGLLSSPAWAADLLIYEVGQEGNGYANAGSAALTLDPSVLMNNPAGITELKGTQISANGQLILGHYTFARDSNNQFDGNEGGNALKYLPGASFFISHQIDDRNAIGFGMYGNFGLMADYDDDWAGRYFNQESTLIGVSFQPTLAHKFTDDFSVGIGPRLVYGYLREEVAVNNSVLGLVDRPDGQLRYKDTDTAAGFNIGLLYKITPSTRIGFAYTSKVKFEFKDRPELKNINNPLLNLALNRVNVDQLELDMNIPQTALLSVVHELDSQWSLLGSVGWQDWSDFGRVGVEVDTNAAGTSTTVDRKYKDSWNASIGTLYQYSPRLRWGIGFGYDSPMVDDSDRTVDNPAGAVWRMSTGVNYDLGDGMDVHFAYTLMWLGDMDVEQTKKRSGTTLSGTYKATALHVLGGGVTWRF
ncbi:OmpP1/FadL family transporter [Pseudomonas citronellolis]|uniref:OmpP1/FadL family transporter n=1 Tax=Pseudomonas citronellolis TaxID=53408 RepID=UPI0023E3B303|nr:outer membrane protein transport protein [Pseudomonas citronellolis]MDF3935563.1 outer membrane protein transport protein [Pseudomonas citronellolis]